MIEKIEHIGIAVENLDEANKIYEQLLGTPPYKMETVDSEGVNTSFFKTGTGDVVEIGLETVKFGKSSITVKCVARVKQTEKIIITIDKIVFVQLDEYSNPKHHGKS